jgi:hypothetical protein
MSVSVKMINPKKIFVRGVPSLATTENIKDLFGKYGPILNVKFWSLDQHKDALTSVAYEFILKELWSFQQFVVKKGYLEDLDIQEDKLQNDEWLTGWISNQNSVEIYIEYQDYRDADDAKKDLMDGKIKMGNVYLSVGVD